MGKGKRKTRVSKNSKRNWRNRVEIGDVEDYLEAKRHEERTG